MIYKHSVREARVWYLNQDHSPFQPHSSVEETPFQTAAAEEHRVPPSSSSQVEGFHPRKRLSAFLILPPTTYHEIKFQVNEIERCENPILYLALNRGKKALPSVQ